MSHNNKTLNATNPPVQIDNGALQMLEIPNLEEAISDMRRGFYISPPRITVEHSHTGKHTWMIDLGPSYNGDDGTIDLSSKFTGIVCLAQQIRALWTEKEAIPTCAAIDNIPSVSEAISHSCISCQHSRVGSSCKQKIRLLVLTSVSEQSNLVVFNLAPTSIKHWRSHIAKCVRTNLPYYAITTEFNLLDVKKHNYRWAEVEMRAGRLISQQELQTVLTIKDKIKQQFSSVDEEDFMIDKNDKENNSEA